MGISYANMPLLYGEGAYTFRRLQLGILSKEDDESISAWRMKYRIERLLVDSPATFKESGDIQRIRRGMEIPKPSFPMTIKGLSIEVHHPWLKQHLKLPRDSEFRDLPIDGTWASPLNCKHMRICLVGVKKYGLLQRLAWKLVSWNKLGLQKSAMQHVYISRGLEIELSALWKRILSFFLSSRPAEADIFLIYQRYKVFRQPGLVLDSGQ